MEVHTRLKPEIKGHCGGGGQLVSVFALYSDDPSLNPADAYSFFYLKNQIKARKQILE